MKVAFWNVGGMGVNSPLVKQNTFCVWCQKMQPDLLILEEVSFTLENALPGMAGMEGVNYVNTLDKNLNPSTKQIWVLEKRGFNYNARPLRFPELVQRRMCLKATSPTSDCVIWGIHANASYWGGKQAILKAEQYLRTSPNACVGGDFNCDIRCASQILGAPPVQICWPRSWNHVYLNFTQWSKDEDIIPTPCPDLHIQSCLSGDPIFGIDRIGRLYCQPKPNEVIDYVMSVPNCTVQALPNCPDEITWANILERFDHCPVVYEITCP